MKKLKIGVDMDGVVTDLYNFQIEEGKKYFKKEPFDTSNYDIKDIFNCSKQERNMFWLKNIMKYCNNARLNIDIKEVLNKLKEDGHEIHFITARVFVDKDNIVGSLFRKLVENYLKKNDIKYDSIHFINEENAAVDKAAKCEELGIDVMIEDKATNVSEISKKTKVACLAAPYNQEIKSEENIYKSTVLFDIYKYIDKLAKGNEFREKNKRELASLTDEEKIQYQEDLKAYYKNLPIKNEAMDKRMVKALKFGLPMLDLILKPIVLNKENIPSKDGYIYVANHLGSLDQFPVIAARGKTSRIEVLAADTLRYLKRGKFYEDFGVLWVDRTDNKSTRSSKEKLASYVLNDTDVCLFPEGTRNRTDQFLLEFKKGAVKLAQETQRPIIPMAINNNYFNGRPLMVNVGEPFYVGPNDDLNEKNDELRNTIATLIYEIMFKEKELKDEKQLRKVKKEEVLLKKM